MQDNAIQARTKLWLNVESENQKQKLADYKLQKEQARTNLSKYATNYKSYGRMWRGG